MGRNVVPGLRRFVVGPRRDWRGDEEEGGESEGMRAVLDEVHASRRWAGAGAKEGNEWVDGVEDWEGIEAKVRDWAHEQTRADRCAAGKRFLAVSGGACALLTCLLLVPGQWWCILVGFNDECTTGS